MSVIFNNFKHTHVEYVPQETKDNIRQKTALYSSKALFKNA